MPSPATELVVGQGTSHLSQGGSYDHHGDPHGDNSIAEFLVPTPSDLVSGRFYEETLCSCWWCISACGGGSTPFHTKEPNAFWRKCWKIQTTGSTFDRHIACSTSRISKLEVNAVYQDLTLTTRRASWRNSHLDFSWAIKPRMGASWWSMTRRISERSSA